VCKKNLCQFLVRTLSVAVVVGYFTTVSNASTEKVLHNFVELGHGAHPQASLIADATGNLYGTTSAGGTFNHGSVFKVSHGLDGKWMQSVLYSFGAIPNDGIQPEASLVMDASGNLYGTTYTGGGGAYSSGTVFELTPRGNGQWSEKVLYNFCSVTGCADGASPSGPVIFDSVGNLYGTIGYGGSNDNGAVFELTLASGGVWTERILYSFTGGPDGALPAAGLILDQQGNLYGTAVTGGDLSCDSSNDPPYGCGTVFKLTHQANDNWIQTVLFTFTGNSDTWSGPVGGVISDSRGNLYGMSGNSGASFGSIFELVPAASGKFKEKILHNFNTTNGYPEGGLIFDADGNLYGATTSSGSSPGIVFRLSPRISGGWQETVLHVFRGGNDGLYPAGGLVADTAGNLYGSTSAGGVRRGFGVVFQLIPTSKGPWKESLLYKFPVTDGAAIHAALVTDSEGSLYGVTSAGGSYECDQAGCGTVFKLSRSADGKWERTVLYEFKGGSDGSRPLGSLIFDPAGNLYGTTEHGGIAQWGTIFELSAAQGGGWKEKILYSFQGGAGGDGASPQSSLVFDGSGNLYGTAAYQGTCHGFGYGCGIVFELSPNSDGTWKEKVLYAFTGQNDGSNPYGSLTFDGAGNLYGTTLLGGGIPNVFGVVFKLSHQSGRWKETVLYNFAGRRDGTGQPTGGLIFDDAGNLYGTTEKGGSKCNYGCGTVFKLTNVGGIKWKENILHTFGTGRDGTYPEGNLIFDKAGNLYGTTNEGGGSSSCSFGCGTVFQLSPTSDGRWHERILHHFNGTPHDGVGPASGLIFGSEGELYGTTLGSDVFNLGGTVYEITP